MSTDTITAASPASRHGWAATLMALVLLTGAFSVSALALPTEAQAATMVIDQCNGHAPGPEGATTALKCTVTVVNTVNGKTTSSTTTVTRLCTLGPCSTPNGTYTTKSASLVTAVRQCNNSDNDAAHTISCSVNIMNNISASTPRANQVGAVAVNQCVGSGTGGGGTVSCTPPAAAAGATVTQCNGSANGGGGTVSCTVDPRSRVSAAIPITVSQCNGTGNVGGSGVTCTASFITNITRAAAAVPPARTATTGATPTRTTAPAATPTTAATASASATPVALGAGTQSTAGPRWEGLLVLLAGLLLAAAVGALAYRRYAPRNWPLTPGE